MGSLDQQLKEANTAPTHGGYSERKRKSMLRTYSQPVYPRLSIVLLVCMLVLTCALTAAEALRSLPNTEMLLRNVSVTGFGIWSLYAVPLILVSLLGMRSNAKRFYQRQLASGVSAQSEDERRRDRRAIQRLNRGYVRYLLLCLAGILAWGVFFLAVR